MLNKFSQLCSKQGHKLFKGIDDTGKPAWWLVKLDALKTPIFDRQRKQGRIVFTDYGEIINSGYGDIPADLMKQFA